MVRTTDPVRIRAILQTDRRWAVYALGDLAPGFFEHCEWLCAPGQVPGLLLLYRAFAPPVLFALGEADTVAPLLDEIRDLPALSLHVPVHIVPLVKERWHVRTELRMWRMVFDPAAPRPATTG